MKKLDYDYIKNHYRSIAVYLSRQKELDANPKEIQQIEFVGQLKGSDGVNAGGETNIVIRQTLIVNYTIDVFLNNFRKNQRNTTKSFSRKRNS